MNKIASIIVFGFIFLKTGLVFAENEWSLQVSWPNSPAGSPLTPSSTIAELVQYFFEWGVAIGVILTFGALIYASFQYLISSGDPQKISKAKNMLSSAFLGLLLLFSSWMLIMILNPELAVISDIGVPALQPDISEDWDYNLTEEDACDYAIIAYFNRGETEARKTMVDEGEVRNIQMEPYYAISCKKRTEVSSKNEEVFFIESRTVSETDRLQPVCDLNCAQDPEESCEEEIFIEKDQNIPKYCYDHRNFDQEAYRYPGALPRVSVGSVKYISQNPDSVEISCLSGDKALQDGGGCVLNLYETTHAARCGQKITDTTPVGSISGDYDRNVNCIEVLRYPPPLQNF